MQVTVDEYFTEKAVYYDDVDLQPYWTFSDEVLWFLLQKLALPQNIHQEFTLLDAGAGTARWTLKVLEQYPNAFSKLVDISSAMLGVAREKLEGRGLAGRSDIRTDDVRAMSHITKESVDAIFCLHNVIGFFEDTQAAISNFFQKLKPGGKCAVMFPSFYHAIYFSNSTGRLNQLQKIKTTRHVQYNDKMPPLKVFELNEIEKFRSIAGFAKVECFGFPLTVYPGMEETYLHGSTSHLVKLFAEPYRTELLEIEKRLCCQPNLSPRGNNILAVFVK